VQRQQQRDQPVIWLGQSVDTSSICAAHCQLNRMPFLTSLGCAIRKPSLKHTHFTRDLKAKLGITGPLMVDSGGFALMRNPRAKWTIRDVSKFVSNIDAEVFVSLDHPPGKRDTASERRWKIELSTRNFKLLSERFPNKTIMPVVHGRTISEIEYSIHLIKRHTIRAKWIGLGGIVPLLQHRAASQEISRLSPEVFIARSLIRIREAFPDAKIHAFGAGGMRTFPALFGFGADSADSIGWRQAAGFGSIFLPLKSQRVVKWNDQKGPPRKLLDSSDLAELDICECPICVRLTSAASRLASFRSSFHSRSIHNARSVVNQFKYWPVGRQRMLSLISSGQLGPGWARAANSLAY
jgi:queuine/archaeosine tRNA-ribosyltransferase